MRLPNFHMLALLWMLPVFLTSLVARGQQLAIDSVTVQPESGFVEIYWSWDGEIPSGATVRYQRYDQGPNGLIYLEIGMEDLASTGLFVDQFVNGSPNASQRQVRYFVTALDQAGETLFSSNIHGTIYLKEFRKDVCDKSLFLSWENYSISKSEGSGESLPVDFDVIQIVTSLNGASSEVEEELDYGPEEVILEQVGPGIYSLFIRAKGAGWSSTSNAIGVDFSALAAPDFPPYIRAVDVVEDQHVQIRLYADNQVVSPSYVLFRSADATGDFQPVDTIASEEQDIFIADHANPNERQWFYRIEMLDSCGQGTAESQTASTLFLRAFQQGAHTNILKWEHQPGWGGGISHYNILRKLPGQDQFILIGETGAASSFEDDLSNLPGEMPSGMFEYRVMGYEDSHNPDGFQEEVISNTASLISEETIFVPNAFRPSSSKAENQVFKPAMVAVSDNGYQLLVFNRWGEQIFMSPVPDEGWDGTVGGEQSPEGVYAWVLRYKDGNGQQKEKRGVVTLIR